MKTILVGLAASLCALFDVDELEGVELVGIERAGSGTRVKFNMTADGIANVRGALLSRAEALGPNGGPSMAREVRRLVPKAIETLDSAARGLDVLDAAELADMVERHGRIGALAIVAATSEPTEDESHAAVQPEPANPVDYLPKPPAGDMLFDAARDAWINQEAKLTAAVVADPRARNIAALRACATMKRKAYEKAIGRPVSAEDRAANLPAAAHSSPAGRS